MTATAEPLVTNRRRMPQRRYGYTTSVTIGDADFYLTANPNRNGTLGEVFIKFGKQDSTLALDFLDDDTRSQLRIYSLDDERRQLTETGSLRS